jgi:hypothetical protein
MKNVIMWDLNLCEQEKYHTATAALVWTPNQELANSPLQYLGLPESFILKDLFPGLKFPE